ncbi:hypothetical protein chiPu_0009692 [Chiloscyllium punctatum]|uniref:Uncharacterized protein n=1 Tax=Chiloscyllium punctatum TaxID=137246 RepID=A0A401SLF2_CHIPU|nr:hypothetical protein [Chiloscyllium punctatum]
MPPELLPLPIDASESQPFTFPELRAPCDVSRPVFINESRAAAMRVRRRGQPRVTKVPAPHTHTRHTPSQCDRDTHSLSALRERARSTTNVDILLKNKTATLMYTTRTG